jgi:hypothetical protein
MRVAALFGQIFLLQYLNVLNFSVRRLSMVKEKEGAAEERATGAVAPAAG